MTTVPQCSGAARAQSPTTCAGFRLRKGCSQDSVLFQRWIAPQDEHRTAALSNASVANWASDMVWRVEMVSPVTGQWIMTRGMPV